jgi:O-antigen/teichoic acid export membrane protein
MLIITMAVPATEDASKSLVGAIIMMKSSESFLDLYYSRLQKSREYVVLGVLSLINAGGTIVLATIAVVLIESVTIAVWASALVSAVVAVIAIISSSRRESSRERDSSDSRPQEPGYRALVAAGAPLAGAQLLIALAVYLPVILVELLGSSAEVGVFATASYLVVFANLVGASVATVALPSFALTLNRQGRPFLLRRAARLSRAAILPGLVVVPVVILAGAPVLGFIYGSGYALTKLELALLAIASVAAVPAYIYSSVLLALNNYRGVTSGSAAAAVAVLGSGVVCFWVGAPAVVAACLSLCIGTLARGGALFAYAHLTRGIADRDSNLVLGIGVDGAPGAPIPTGTEARSPAQTTEMDQRPQ